MVSIGMVSTDGFRMTGISEAEQITHGQAKMKFSVRRTNRTIGWSNGQTRRRAFAQAALAGKSSLPHVLRSSPRWTLTAILAVSIPCVADTRPQNLVQASIKNVTQDTAPVTKPPATAQSDPKAPPTTTPQPTKAPVPQQTTQTFPGITIPGGTLLPIQLNFRLWNGIPIVEGRVNGGALESIALATGLNQNAVTPDGDERLKLKHLTSQVSLLTLDTTTLASEAQVNELQFNFAKLKEARVVVADVYSLLTVVRRPDTPALWLGVPFFTAFQTTFDFEKHLLRFANVNAPLPKEEGAITIPLEKKNGRLFVRLSIPRGGSFSAFVDTASPGTLIPATAADRLKLTPLKTLTVRGKDGKQAQAQLVKLPALLLGKAEQKNFTVLHLLKNAPPEFDKTLGILGTDFLSHYRVTISIAHSKMVLVPAAVPDTDKTGADNTDEF